VEKRITIKTPELRGIDRDELITDLENELHFSHAKEPDEETIVMMVDDEPPEDDETPWNIEADVQEILKTSYLVEDADVMVEIV
jgi:hypothetical protein